MADVSFILLYVESVETSQAFYEAILGRPALESSPTFAMLPAAPGLTLGLWRRDRVEPKAAAPGGGEIAIALSDEAAVEAMHDEWRARGARIAQPPTKMDFGFTFVALDPDGHRVRAFVPQG